MTICKPTEVVFVTGLVAMHKTVISEFALLYYPFESLGAYGVQGDGELEGLPWLRLWGHARRL